MFHKITGTECNQAMLCKAVLTSYALLLKCLGDQWHVIIYYVHCDTQLLVFGFLFFETLRQN